MLLAASNVDHGHESESCSSSVESAIEEDRVALRISEQLKTFLDLDCNMITKNDKLVNLPAKIPVVTILENFVKYQSIRSICGPHSTDAPRRRNSAAKFERREKDYDKLKLRYEWFGLYKCIIVTNDGFNVHFSIDLRKEVADGLRIYFDFLLKDFLLYHQERDQADILLSDENLTNFTYIASERQSLDAILSLKQGTPNTPFGSASDTGSEPQAPLNGSDTTNVSVSGATTDDNNSRRRLRSYKNAEESEFVFDFNSIKAPSISNVVAPSDDPISSMSCISLLKELIPPNMTITYKTRELLQNILSWQILPSDAPAEPSMIYGSVHLGRLMGKANCCRLTHLKCSNFSIIDFLPYFQVKLPDFLNALSIPDEKLKLLLQYMDGFIE